MTVKKITQYNPQRDAQAQRELNKHFLKIIPFSTIQYFNQFLIEHLYKKLKVTEGFILDQLFTEYPMLLRVLAYIYSPPEDYDTRIKMLELWDEADLTRKDYRNPQVQHDVFFCRSLQRLPKVTTCPTLKAFLNGLYNDFSLVINSDNLFSQSKKGSIQELRNNWPPKYEDENKKIITIDLFPFYKIKHCINKKTNQIEIHYHLLKDDEDLHEFFTDTDAYLTEWLQLFFEERQSGKPPKLFIHGPDGELVKPPGKHKNPFAFDLPTKYYGWIQSIAKGDNSKISDVTLAFYKAIDEWKGDREPVKHLSRTTLRRFDDFLRSEKPFENIRMEKSPKLMNESKLTKRGCPQRIPIDEVQDPNEEESFEKYTSRKEKEKIITDKKSETKTHAQRIIYQNHLETLKGYPRMNDQELKDRLYNETGQEITTAGIRNARVKINNNLKELFK